MNLKKTIFALGLLIVGAAATGSVLAHHGGHGRFGVFIGAPLYYPGPYYYPPYYAPYPYPYYAPAPVPAEPPAYIERSDSGAPPYAERDEGAPPVRRRGEGSWYFCSESNAYYPYVKQCAGGWQRVAPRPPADSGAER